MTNDTRPSIDIQYSESVNREAISALRYELEDRLSTSVETHLVGLRSFEIPMVISIVVVSATWLLRLFGVPEYFKIRMQERARIDARKANEKRMQRVRSSHWFVASLSKHISDGASVTIGLHIPPEHFENRMNADHFGGLLLKGTNKEMIAAELDLFLQYVPALQHLIETEITPNPILGGVYLKLLDDGLEVSWIPQEMFRKRVRVLRTDDGTA